MAIINTDFASLYPTVMRDLNDDAIKMKERRKKIDKILDNINNENII